MLIDKKAVAVAERLVFFSSPQSKEHIASCLMSAELDFTATGLRLELTIESPAKDDQYQISCLFSDSQSVLRDRRAFLGVPSKSHLSLRCGNNAFPILHETL